MIKQNLLIGSPTHTFDIICANPPYVPAEETKEKIQSGWKEPALALDGGKNGLDLINEIFKQSRIVLKPGAYLYMEFGDGQSELVSELATEHGFSDIQIRADLAGLPRIIRCRTESK